MKRSYILLIGILLLLLVGGYFVVQEYSKTNDKGVLNKEKSNDDRLETQLNSSNKSKEISMEELRIRKIDSNSGTHQINQIQKVVKNQSLVTFQNDVFEIKQSFVEKRDESDVIGEIVDINLTKTSGAMISAYSESKGEYSVYFRTLENKTWSNWIKLEENKEVQNPNRRVFSPKSLNNFVTQIQFKSNQAFNEDIIFRIFTFKNK